MTFSPTKVNSGNSRPVNQINVLNAENRDVEREQLNRILSSLGERISVVESSSGSSSGGSSSSSFTITTDSSLSAISGTDTYQISVAVGGVTENRLASNAVTTAKIANNAVTDAKFRQSTGLSVVGRSANSTGNVADITAGTDGHVLRRSGTTLGFGTIPNTSVTGLGTMSTQDANNVAITGGTGVFTGPNDTSVPLQVLKGTPPTAPTWNAVDALVIAADGGGNTTLQILAGTAANSNIHFSDSDARGRGQITYRHATDDMLFAVGASTRLSLTSAGASITGTLSTTGALQVGASASALTNTINGNTAIKTSNPVLRLDGATDWDLQSVDSDGRFRLLSGGAVEVFSVSSTGNTSITGTLSTTGNTAIGNPTLPGTARMGVAGGRTFLGANNEVYALGLSYSATLGNACYIGASNSATPDMIFSNAGGTELVRFGNSGVISITGTLSVSTTTSTGDYYQVTDVHTVDANTGTESLTVNWSNGSVQKCRRGGNFTINTITGPSEHVPSCTLYVYDTSAIATITYPSNMRFLTTGGAILAGGAGTWVYNGFWDGSSFWVVGFARDSGDQRPS